ncbi:alpha/beta hydrolase [Klebsiella sp. BIGb0407]|uniref:alpha/beta hydrolase n=1 Tax=Klebsiella sp. BIGb0407 TaxID=2940603 RepID=UPI00216A1570|nr:dienelactone hydrolase family protein [Klebsiella sp. BIGb0407]MCS3431195.1 phospholipase/carboxylesterase [Klebsiella sp. BIGb0407]
MSKNLIVLLHGVGSRGSDLQGVAERLKQAIPQISVALPDGTSAFDMGPGFQWFSVSGVTEENRPARILAARQAFDARLAEAFKLQDINPETDRVILVGFSQGSIMAMDTLIRGDYPLAGVVAFSGRLASPLPLQPRADSAALLIHGKADPVIPWQESQKAAETLSAAGVQVELSIEEHVPHTITLAGIRTAAEFIKQRLTLTG